MTSGCEIRVLPIPKFQTKQKYRKILANTVFSFFPAAMRQSDPQKLADRFTNRAAYVRPRGSGSGGLKEMSSSLADQ